MALLDKFAPAGATDQSADAIHRAAQGMESLFLRQILSASGAFKGSDVPGGGIRAGLFVEAIADAVAKAGGIGLAHQLESSLGSAAPGARPSQTALQSPLDDAGKVTSHFGVRTDPFTGQPALHRGIDLAAPEGTVVHAALGGTVRRAGDAPGYGQRVEVDHGDGTSTVYGHASELLVKEGDQVAAGDPIARVGHSGRATGDHLHFELRQGGHPVDPTRALKVYRQRADKPLAQPPFRVQRGSK